MLLFHRGVQLVVTSEDGKLNQLIRYTSTSINSWGGGTVRFPYTLRATLVVYLQHYTCFSLRQRRGAGLLLFLLHVLVETLEPPLSLAFRSTISAQCD